MIFQWSEEYFQISLWRYIHYQAEQPICILYRIVYRLIYISDLEIRRQIINIRFKEIPQPCNIIPLLEQSK